MAIALVVATAMIFKAFIFKGCFAFDSNDDANHTFVNLHVARSLLSLGQLPLMNIFNNFGTPLVGDALTYPFSIQSITYWFFSNPLALTINRFLITFFTILFTAKYFRNYMSTISAQVCAVVVFSTPGFIWHVAHHHYQLAVLGFVSILFFQEKYTQTGNVKDFTFLYCAHIITALSTSINVVLFMLPFFVVNQLLFSKAQNLKRSVLAFVPFFTGLAFYFPDALALFKSITSSGRVSENYGGSDYYTFKQVLLGIVGQPTPWTTQIDRAIYLSIPVVVSLVIGLIYLIKKRAEKSLIFRVSVLGVGMYSFVITLMYVKDLWWSIPLLRAVDITRFTWFSNVFILMGAGIGLDSLVTYTWTKKEYLSFVLGCLFLLCFYQFVVKWGTLENGYRYPAFFFDICLLGLYVAVSRHSNPTQILRRIKLLIGFSVLLAHYPSFSKTIGLDDLTGCKKGSHHFSDQAAADFQPQVFLRSIVPYSRIATAEPSIEGTDLKAGRFDVFGSSGRSVLLNKGLADYLLSQHLIEVDQTPLAYHFVKPWDAEKYGKLGIKYLIQKEKDPDAETRGWKLAASTDSRFLYENPTDVSLIYLIEGNKRTPVKSKSITFQGNKISIELPQVSTEQEIVATFMNRPGWILQINNQDREIFSKNDLFMRFQVRPGDQAATLEYKPYSIADVVLVALISLIFTYSLFFYFGRGKSSRSLLPS